jgi:hypothetical protein
LVFFFQFIDDSASMGEAEEEEDDGDGEAGEILFSIMVLF